MYSSKTQRLWPLTVLALWLVSDIGQAGPLVKIFDHPLRATWTRQGQQGFLTLPISEVFDKSLTERLESGLTNRLILTTKIFVKRKQKLLGQALWGCRMIFDLWEEVYKVEIVQGSATRLMSLQKKTDLIRVCSRVEELVFSLPLGKTPPLWAEVTVEVNPIPPELRTKAKELMTPRRDPGARSPSRSLFGTFMRFFVNPKRGPAGVIHRYRGWLPAATPG